MKRTFLLFSSVLIMTSMIAVKPTNLEIVNDSLVSISEMQPYLDAFSKIIEIPTGYQLHSVSKVNTDNVSAYLFRFEKLENTGLMGEHFSFIISEKDKQILGFTNMDKKYSNLEMLTKEETERISKDFLSRLDSTLANDLRNLWTERHDEEVLVNGQKMVLAGMKYKCFRASKNDYTWVIVEHDGSIVTFERNIKWDNNEHKRITEKWLHDNWLNKK